MRRFRLPALLLVALLALTGAAFADTVAVQPAAAPLPVETPAPLDLSSGVVWSGGSCTATNNCNGGTPVSCQGNNSCDVIASGVRCDGVVTYCPGYCELEATCNCWCGETAYLFCNSLNNDCQQSSSYIRCDGQYYACVGACYNLCGPFTQQP